MSVMLTHSRRVASLTRGIAAWQAKLASHRLLSSTLDFSPDRIAANKDKSTGSSDIVSPYGDNSPYVNPLVLLPSVSRPIFPGFLSTMLVHDNDVIKTLKENREAGQSYVGVFLRTEDMLTPEAAKQDGDIVPNLSFVHKVGTLAQVEEITKVDNGAQLLLMGHRRIDLLNIESVGPPSIGIVNHWAKKYVEDKEDVVVKAYSNEVMNAIRDLIAINPLVRGQIQHWLSRVDISDPYKLGDFATAICSSTNCDDLQKILESSEADQRLNLALDALIREKEVARLQQDITKQVEAKVNKNQKDYFLREQLKTIKKELGMEKDDKEGLVSKYQAHLEEFKGRNVDEASLKLIGDEISKLESLEKNSAEFNVTRTYLDWLVQMPWNKYSKDSLHLRHAKKILDQDHFGMEDVKQRILEFIAVGQLRGTVVGKILCFIGPPGVGKTSIAKSIASALDKPFYRFSVGGLSDTAEVKGHRRTYVGAMPGKPIQSLKTTNCLNPLILVDEIDKLGRGGNGGDPASALLELLDPNQNTSFVDHYLDTPMDFSRVLFVCTANDESTIPNPLWDRMEIINLSGYDLQEKIQIARKYLVPQAIKDVGLHGTTTTNSTQGTGTGDSDGTGDGDGGSAVRNSAEWNLITDGGLAALVKQYCRESGVRSLEKMIQRIARKLAYKQVLEQEETVRTNQEPPLERTDAVPTLDTTVKTIDGAGEELTDTSSAAPLSVADLSQARTINIVIDEHNLEEYAGKPKFTQDNMYEVPKKDVPLANSIVAAKEGQLPIGVVMGLAWSPVGGSPIFVETVATPCSYSERAHTNIYVVTGQLGSVMKESTDIAFTFARKYIASVDAENTFFHNHQLHMHCPEGAVSKDGPSAGVAMATAIVSCALNKPVLPKAAMTGEISLTGKVLPIGGVKEKTLAAKRAGATVLLLPLANKRDYDELPDYVREGVTAHFISEYKEAFQILFPHDDSQQM